MFCRVAEIEGINNCKDAMSKGLTKEAFADHVVRSTEFIGLVGLRQTQSLPAI